jgi:hypothetical protein
MSTFIGRLQLDFGDFGSAGRYARTISPITYRDDELGVGVFIPMGEMSDGASVPRFLWWFMPPWGDRSTLAALLHDYLQRRLVDGDPHHGADTDELVDRHYHRALLALGVPGWKAALAYAGVQICTIARTLTGWPPIRYEEAGL